MGLQFYLFECPYVVLGTMLSAVELGAVAVNGLGGQSQITAENPGIASLSWAGDLHLHLSSARMAGAVQPPQHALQLNGSHLFQLVALMQPTALIQVNAMGCDDAMGATSAHGVDPGCGTPVE